MNLIIDVGNSYTKFAVFDKHDLIHTESCETRDVISVFQKLKADYPKLSKGILSSVGHLSLDQLNTLKHEIDLIVLDSDTSLPFKNLYKTPKTLGVDRMALVSAAVLKFPNKDALVIDAGTCITYDFVDSDAQYHGGAISPGIKLRYKSLNDYTANLPLLEISVPHSKIGNTTAASIHSGVVNGVLYEIEGAIKEYIDTYNDLTVILTGGDGNFLSKQLKNSIFANSNFLLEGLNFILDHNSN